MSGIQLSFMPKLSFGYKKIFFVGAGLSMGIGVHDIGESTSGYNTTWLNAEFGSSRRYSSGIGISSSVGFTKGLSGCFSSCEHRDSSSNSDFSFSHSTYAADYFSPQARMGIGYWF